jgi:hypothetical protein
VEQTPRPLQESGVASVLGRRQAIGTEYLVAGANAPQSKRHPEHGSTPWILPSKQ